MSNTPSVKLPQEDDWVKIIGPGPHSGRFAKVDCIEGNTASVRFPLGDDAELSLGRLSPRLTRPSLPHHLDYVHIAALFTKYGARHTINCLTATNYGKMDIEEAYRVAIYLYTEIGHMLPPVLEYHSEYYIDTALLEDRREYTEDDFEAQGLSYKQARKLVKRIQRDFR